jgi:drug/metabolite transporter (DMT)-like permease
VVAGAGGEQALAGDVIGLLSGLAFASLILVLRRLSREETGEGCADPTPTLLCFVLGNLLACLAGLPALGREIGGPGVIGHAPLVGWMLLLWLGVGQLGGGYWFFQRGLRTTRALTAGLLVLAEPMLNPVWVALIVGEIPGRGTVVGGAVILSALVIAITSRARR